MARYHVNTVTGDVSACKAKVRCPFGDLDADHYTSKEAAREAYEKSMETFETPHVLDVDKMRERFVRPQDLDYDTIDYEFRYIETWEKPWTQEELSNMALVEVIGSIVEREPFTRKDEREALDLVAQLEPYIVVPSRRGVLSSDDDSWRARDKMIHSLADSLIIRRRADALSHEPAEELRNENILNLQAAQEAALKHFNHPPYDFYAGPYLGAVEPHFQEAIARVKRGDAPAPEDLLRGEDQRSLLPDSERIFNTLHPDSRIYDQQLYLASVYPVNELKDEMDRAGLTDVSVTPFQNGREWGNVYTVLQPDGSTRAFSVYEHRNSNSIIINGSSDWDGNGHAYAADSKNKFFAEFSPDDRKRSAQALTFYMMQAQRGELETDEELVDKASHRDWNAILDKSIPGFKEWRQERITDTYIAPEDETDEDVLKRLDFKDA